MMKTKNQNEIQKNVLRYAARALFFGGICGSLGTQASDCVGNMVKSSIYFVPHVRDYCSTPEPCAAFKSVVNMQGSGTLTGGKVLKYTGKKEDIGSCDTAIGAAGECLIPYVSVAADMNYYRLGDVIAMPSMKGKEITLPDGRTMVHPGYFIVHDTGGAIKGENRFDFFTGSARPEADHNAFGYGQALSMSDINQCGERKQFRVVNTADEQATSIAAIEAAISGAASGSMIASSGVK